MKAIYFLSVFLIGLAGFDNMAEVPGAGMLLRNDTTTAASETDNILVRRFYEPDKLTALSVETIYQQMSIGQRAAQMIMVATTSSGGDYRKARELVEDEIAGSVLLLKGSKSGFIEQVATLNSYTAKKSLPPLYACDCEPSLLQRKWSGTPYVVPAGAQTDNTMVRKAAETIAYEMHEVGAGLNFAPVVDLAVNRSIINNRSFGNTGAVIAERAGVFIQTTQAAGIAATVKHFPGHGAVKGDSHKAAVFIDGPLTELETFRTTIAKNRPLVTMVGHITVRNNKQYGTNGLPSSISGKIITGLLRKELGFEGVIATDAMNMKAVARYKNADWLAVAAGADLIVMPSNPRRLHAQIVEALKQNNELSNQLEASIKRVIKLKIATTAAQRELEVANQHPGSEADTEAAGS